MGQVFPNFTETISGKLSKIPSNQHQFWITSILPNYVSVTFLESFKILSPILLNFFKILLQCSQNFVKIPQELLRVNFKNLKNIPKNLDFSSFYIENANHGNKIL